uniref:Uncharacterized protein n=1 Tax=Molossus molossus TaxID=27622 RepID=A0A7J8IZ81_MOLMO|nr:hypothetical protein HJG59_010276 [Molossus molossus]
MTMTFWNVSEMASHEIQDVFIDHGISPEAGRLRDLRKDSPPRRRCSGNPHWVTAAESDKRNSLPANLEDPQRAPRAGSRVSLLGRAFDAGGGACGVCHCRSTAGPRRLLKAAGGFLGSRRQGSLLCSLVLHFLKIFLTNRPWAFGPHSSEPRLPFRVECLSFRPVHLIPCWGGIRSQRPLENNKGHFCLFSQVLHVHLLVKNQVTGNNGFAGGAQHSGGLVAQGRRRLLSRKADASEVKED